MEGRAQHFANPPAIDDLLDFSESKGNVGLYSHNSLDALFPGKANHLFGLGGILRQRPLTEDVLPGLQAREKGFIVLVDAHRADDKVDVWVCGEVLRGAVRFGCRGQAMGFDGSFGAFQAGIAEGNNLVLGAGFEVGEVSPDGPGLGRGDANEANANGCHCEERKDWKLVWGMDELIRRRRMF